jgi:hypothetical protein
MLRLAVATLLLAAVFLSGCGGQTENKDVIQIPKDVKRLPEKKPPEG